MGPVCATGPLLCCGALAIPEGVPLPPLPITIPPPIPALISPDVSVTVGLGCDNAMTVDGLYYCGESQTLTCCANNQYVENGMLGIGCAKVMPPM
ncbi:hypothetical protein JAAARDRAFT_204020 [Jaapia argillacea MUCL 33604]|uniref:Uncharacterized protein n=1 Tax=Jaapia argillacea MUCL 33604 TaxID=933084 RepID=A0A067QFZ1_9AGAM|nr:hypothetical protein JAAARDRAFT_204020 [Jaapia argillacea MUCL 33604]